MVTLARSLLARPRLLKTRGPTIARITPMMTSTITSSSRVKPRLVRGEGRRKGRSMETPVIVVRPG
jgi:hypothetical protein